MPGANPPDTSGLQLYDLFGDIDKTVDNMQVGAMEVVYLTRLIDQIALPSSLSPNLHPGNATDGMIRLNVTRLSAMGQSMGTTFVGSTDDCGFSPFGDDTSTARETAFAKIRARVDEARFQGVFRALASGVNAGADRNAMVLDGVLEVRKLRYEARSLATMKFRIQAGAGFVPVHEPGDEPAAEVQRKLLVVNLADPFPGELLPRRDHELLRATALFFSLWPTAPTPMPIVSRST